MQFGLSESQNILKTNARKFFAAECPMTEVRRLMEEGDGYHAGLWSKMAEQGYLGVIFPEEYGGLGLGMVELAVLLEEMGTALAPGPYFSSVILAGTLLEAAGSDGVKKRYLKPLCEGKLRATAALLEGAANWTFDAVKMQVTGDLLSGTKMFVTDAAAADFIIVPAMRDGELTLWIVNAKASGLAITPMPALDLTRKLYKLTFDCVEASDLLASGAAARGALERMADIGAMALSAETTGGMQRVMDIAVAYVKTRKQFGKPVGIYQAVQHQCADMLVFTESSRSASYYAAYALQESTADAQAAVSVAKAYTSDAGREVGNRGIQVHGGMGFTWENDVHLYYRRAKANEIALGDATYHRERIARLVVDRASRPAQA
ncbi:MAG: acyl-CoA/acyl-ACP dehydrogenase [Bryobacteraceae bacterium]|nr:acyl-CoA/acyl-ACP dehydrogenase [Bryobacteraceae bacterium]